METQAKPFGWIVAAVAAAAAAIFILDMATPLGIAVPMFYVLPILLTRYIPGWRSTVFLAVVIITLTWVELVLVPAKMVPLIVGNRATASFLLLVVAGLVLKQKDLAQRYARDQAALLRSEQRLGGILWSATEAIISVDERQCITLFNKAAEGMFGCAAAEAIGQPLDRFLPERFRQAHRVQVEEFGRSGITARRMGRLGMVYGLRENGREFPAEASISRIESGGEKLYTVILRDLTERIQAEEALRESEERYALVVAGAEAAIWDWNVPEKRVFFSPRWKALRGLADDEVSDREEEWSRRIHPDDRDRVMAAVGAHFEGRTAVFAEEYRIRHKDGHWIWILDHGIAKRDGAGKVIRMAGSETDITARKQAEEALRESEDRLLLALESANMGTWEWDAETDSLLCNHWQFTLFGVRAEAGPRTGTEALSRIHADDRERVCAAIRRVLEEGVTVRDEFRVVHADGSVHWLFGSGRPVQDERGRIRHAVGVCLDITERRLEQDRVKSLNDILEERVRERTAQLVEANERWDWVVRATNDGVWDWDLLNDKLYYSPRWKRMHGFQEDDRLESTEEWSARIHPEDRSRVCEALDRCLAGNGSQFHEEYRIQKKDGTNFWVLDRGIAIFDDQGRAIRMVGSETDITWRKEADELLREREAQLRDLGARLLRAQEEERRRISRDLHDDVMQRMGALALELYGLASSNSSHETELLSQIKVCGASAEQLTTDLQRMAHQLHPSVLEFGGLEMAVREQVNDFGARTGLSAELLTQDVPKDIPLDHATCLYRVLQEGLQNVQKHAKATTVLVRLLWTDRGLGLCIHDDGHGIEEVDGAVRRKGLGLTSMAERVGMLNGTFRISTKPGDGTELHAWVPLEDAKREMGGCETRETGDVKSET
ncbi:MAG: PAS domain S-box protein [Nitrospira sp.]